MTDRRFVVKENIPVGGVLAFTRGQVITDTDVVERNGWQDFVVNDGTKEAREIKAEVSGRDVSDFETSSGTTTTTSRTAAKSTTTQEG
jgi:hypothetical protein